MVKKRPNVSFLGRNELITTSVKQPGRFPSVESFASVNKMERDLAQAAVYVLRGGK